MDKNSVFNNILSQYLSKENLKRSALAKSLGLDKDKLNNYAVGKAKWDINYMDSVASFFGKTVDDFIGNAKQVNNTPITKKLVPIIGFADCGKPAASWYNNAEQYKFIDIGESETLINPFILIAKGDSMKPYIQPGDKLLASEMDLSRIKNQTAVIVFYKGIPETVEANAKLIIKKNEYATFYSINTRFPPEDVAYENIIKIYKLKKIIRDVK